MIAKLFTNVEDSEKIVSLVERVIWYLWTVESDNSLYKLINDELRRNPTMTNSKLFPASFKYLTHMTKRKELNCQEERVGADGYWRGESSVTMADGSETFWLMEKKLLHFEEGYVNKPDCPAEEERALFQAGFISWTSNKASTVPFLQGINKVLFKLNGSIEITMGQEGTPQEGTPVVNYIPNITTTLERLRFFSALPREYEFLLDSGLLIFKCDGRKRYRIEQDAPYQGAYKYGVYYLSKENFPDYVIAKAIERISTKDRKRVVELMRGTLHPLFKNMIDQLFSGNMISISNIKDLDIWEIDPEHEKPSLDDLWLEYQVIFNHFYSIGILTEPTLGYVFERYPESRKGFRNRLIVRYMHDFLKYRSSGGNANIQLRELSTPDPDRKLRENEREKLEAWYNDL